MRLLCIWFERFLLLTFNKYLKFEILGGVRSGTSFYIMSKNQVERSEVLLTYFTLVSLTGYPETNGRSFYKGEMTVALRENR